MKSKQRYGDKKFSEIWRGTEVERDTLYYGLNDEEREAREIKLY